MRFAPTGFPGGVTVDVRVDEDPEHLGEQLRLPAQHEHLRAQLERSLTPLVNPRTDTAPS